MKAFLGDKRQSFSHCTTLYLEKAESKNKTAKLDKMLNSLLEIYMHIGISLPLNNLAKKMTNCQDLFYL